MRIRIGTRESTLALWQAYFVRAALLKVDRDLEVELVHIGAEDDETSEARHVSDLMTHAIEVALLEGEVDVAVHSLKHLPTNLADGLELGAVPRREDPADGLISKGDRTLEQLPEGAIVLTGSPRRRAQLLHLRPDLDIRPVHGDVPTRITTMRRGRAHAVMLACAGLARLGMAHVASERLEPERFIPAPGQGALGLELREDDASVRRLCEALDDPGTRLAVTAERAFMRNLGADRATPASACARWSGEHAIHIIGMVAEPDGSRLLREELTRTVKELPAAERLGHQLAEKLRDRGCSLILKSVRSEREKPDG
jgi:hydroxymethylbilane synthase